MGQSPPEHNRAHVVPTVVVASRYGTLWALAARDGAILWRLSPIGRKPVLVHGGDALFVSSHIPLAAFRELDHYNGAPIPPGRPWPIAHAAPADIAALRISDGTTIWQQEGWGAPAPPAAPSPSTATSCSAKVPSRPSAMHTFTPSTPTPARSAGPTTPAYKQAF